MEPTGVADSRDISHFEVEIPTMTSRSQGTNRVRDANDAEREEAATWRDGDVLRAWCWTKGTAPRAADAVPKVPRKDHRQKRRGPPGRRGRSGGACITHEGSKSRGRWKGEESPGSGGRKDRGSRDDNRIMNPPKTPGTVSCLGMPRTLGPSHDKECQDRGPACM